MINSPEEIPFFLLIILGFIVGLLGGLLGVGGGWLIIPALHSFGVSMVSAVATGLAQMMGTSFISLERHHRRGNVDFVLGGVIGLFMIPSVFAGKTLLLYLENLGHAGTLTRTLYIVLLTFIGGRMILGAVGKKTDIKKDNLLSKMANPIRFGPVVTLKKSQKRVHLPILCCIGLLGGFLSGIMGLGGGFILVPCMTYIIGVSALEAIASTLVCVFFASVSGSFLYNLSGKVYWDFAGYILIGSFFGSLIGVASTQYVEDKNLRLLFGQVLFFAALSSLSKQLNFFKLAQFLILIPAGVILLYSITSLIKGKFGK
jgi:hypothetical protein